MSEAEAAAVPQRSFWRHRRKGGRYEAILPARLEGTGEECVVYRSMQTGDVWVRPLGEFLSRFRRE
jgi:hypothetical protein